jgi:cysteine desulfurase
MASAEYLVQDGFRVEKLPVDRGGRLDVQEAARRIDDQSRLVSVMLGNNETGVLQPVTELAELCRAARVPLHTDAIQVVGKLPIDFQQFGVDALSISAHKFHGPRGIGALILRHGVEMRPLLVGGFQQQARRPGTESIALAVGLLTALRLWQEEAVERTRRMQDLRDRMETALVSSGIEMVINGAPPRLPHTSNISFLGLDRQALQMALDLAGVLCSTGSACASGSSEPSPVLLALKCDQAIVGGSLRISLGATTTAEEIDEAAARIISVVRDLGSRKTH